MADLIQKLEQFVADMEKRMEDAVAEMLDKPFPVLTEEKFALFETTGNRLIYEHEYFGKRRFLALYGVAALRMQMDELEMLGTVSREDICKKLEAVLLDICEEECWALPAHVNRQDGSDWRNTVDLFASETAEATSYLVDMLADWLSEECCKKVRENVKRRILNPFFESEIGRWNWEQSEHNWNAVCNGSIGMAYLHTLEEEEEARWDYVDRICGNLGFFIDGYADDGTCMEGLGYFDYGMTYFTNLAMELYDASEGEIDMLRGDWDKYEAGVEDKRAKIAAWWSRCFFKSGRTLSFSDGSSNGKFRMGLGCALAMRFPEVKLPDFKMAGSFEEDHCARFAPYKMDYFFTRRYLEQLKAQTDDKQNGTDGQESDQGEFIILDSAQWCIGKAANGVGMSCKGGHNREPHNHNDIASFMYVVGEDLLLTDLGAGEYTKEYFSAGRYNVFCNNSFSHNVPVIAEQGQKPGREYKATAFEAKEVAGYGKVKISAAAAYEEGLIAQFDRYMTFDTQDGDLEIVDLFDNNGEAVLVTENLVTQVEPQFVEGGIFLDGASASCRVEVEILDGENKNPAPSFRSVVQMHSTHSGVQEQVYRILFDVPVKDTVKVAIRIYPIVK